LLSESTSDMQLQLSDNELQYIAEAIAPKLRELLTTQSTGVEIITPEELRTRLNISPATEIRHRKRGLIPFIFVGNVVRYNWPAVVQSLENKKGKR
jgi:hypothetical protein